MTVDEGQPTVTSDDERATPATMTPGDDSASDGREPGPAESDLREAAAAPEEIAWTERSPVSCSVIIPVHNRASLTRQCLNTLLAQHDTRIEREIIVVNDGSVDLTPRLLAAYGDRVHVVTHEQAQGFAAACNAGAAAATGDYLVFLNNDTVPRVNWLSALAAYAEARPRAAVVGAKLVYPNDTVQHAGVVFGLDRFPHHLYAGFPANHPAVNKSRRFQAVTAACCLIRRQPWEEMGGFDLGFVNGWEDVDLCLRLGAAGHEIHYCHESVVYHLESASRDILAAQEQANRGQYVERWQDKIEPDDLRYYAEDDLLSISYGPRYPAQFSVSPLLGGITAGEDERVADQLLADRARQAAILLRNNIVLNVRVQEAELRAQDAMQRAAGFSQTGALTIPSDDGSRAARQKLHPIIGAVESPARAGEVFGGEDLPISGWALSHAGIWRVETLIDGIPRGEITYQVPRPDVAAGREEYPDALHCGFAGAIPIANLTDGEHGLIIRVIAKDGQQVELATRFERDASGRTSGRIMIACDQPNPAARTVVRDRLPVVGWALAPAGVRSVETLVDGEPRGQITYGMLRPDVALTHPQYPSASHCGFTGSVPVGDLADGEHTLVVRVTSLDGRHSEIRPSFEVDSSSATLGEVPHVNLEYPSWRRDHQPSPEDLARAKAETAALAEQPVISLLVPVGDSPPGAIETLLAMLREQIYDDWELCLVTTEATSAETHEAIAAAADDARITTVAAAGEGGVAAAANQALASTGGELVAVLDPGDRLSPLALSDIARASTEDPARIVIYGDEDKLDPATGVAWDPFFKPDWSPDLLLAMNYIGHFAAIRRSAIEAIGGYRPFPGNETYDLLLRATEGEGQVHHIPRVLISRQVPVTARPARPPAPVRAASREVVTETLARRAIAGTVEEGIVPGTHRVRYVLADQPAVTIVLPSGGKMQFLRPCLDSLLTATTYPNLHLLVIDNSDGDEVAALCRELAETHPNVRHEPLELKPFNFSAIINHAIPLVETPYLILLNDDITVITPDWIETMLEHAQRPEVGVVGPKLLYPDNTIQHAGVILGPYDGSGHAFKQYEGDYTGYFGLPNVTRNYSAVTFACAMLRRSLFDEVGLLDAEHLPIAFNDVDLCLRARERGYQVIYTPHAVLYHHESVTKTVIASPSEIEHLQSRWRHVIAHDPFYNPNLTRRAEDLSLNME